MAEVGKFFIAIGSKLDSKGFDKARKSINNVAKAGLVMGAGLVAVGIKVANMAGIQEKAEKGVADALALVENQAGITVEQLKAEASAIQKVTTVGDEASLEIMKLGLNMGISADQIAGATRDTIGLSKAFGIDLKASMKVVALARAGDFNMLQRYVPQLKLAKTEAEKTAILNKVLANSYQLAQDETSTYAGKLKQLSNRWGDFLETVGDKVIPVISTLVDIINDDVLPALEGWSGDTDKSTKATNIFAFALKSVIQIMLGVVSAFDLLIRAGSLWQAVRMGQFKRAGRLWDELKTKTSDYGDKFQQIANIEIGKTIEKEGIKRDEDTKTFNNKTTLSEQEIADAKAKAEEKAQIDADLKAKLLAKQEEFNAEVEALNNQLADAWVNNITSIQDVWKSMGNVVINTVLKELITQMLVAVGVAKLLRTVIGSITGGFGSILGGVGKVLGFAGGGTLYEPVVGTGLRSGNTYTFGEKGAEHIIPAGKGGLGGGNVFITVPPISTRAEAKRLGELMGDTYIKKVQKTRKIS